MSTKSIGLLVLTSHTLSLLWRLLIRTAIRTEFCKTLRMYSVLCGKTTKLAFSSIARTSLLGNNSIVYLTILTIQSRQNLKNQRVKLHKEKRSKGLI